jgi:hypothetical protein
LPVHTFEARPHFPSQAGTSCMAGASTTRTWDGQPSPSGICRRQGTLLSGVDAGPPGGPSTQTFPQHPSGIRPHKDHATSEASERHAGPALAKSKDEPRLTLARSQGANPTRHLLTTGTPPTLNLARSPLQTRHPRSAHTLASAHPPCSRKGPLLSASGLKCPRRVKRETTNSRFSALWGLCQISRGLPLAQSCSS